MNNTKIAFIGCGRMGHTHLKALMEMYDKGYDDFEIAAFCDTDKTHAVNFAEEYKAHTLKRSPRYSRRGQSFGIRH